ncbi:Predicted kinase, aminoglycoside phosphotransferase (APT) family [Jatrophihabitans endophyticus]|uniref:Predicted kinase, aminoglycoside phosphotransferase (APT) family n=1 Tax=Jatrophihabitans endophyticus TaxID=1206085 RepID=A0A1M5PVI3_9ACTN|nr:phosphotransferase family protein [Jatrophihabitans endophyticus]SHH05702.1 Predicted kinase, aminoglycoside phosphotransferase (APT) family [Jatrophihabitans endophyticus]
MSAPATDRLTRPDVVGALLAEVTGDERWRRPRATLIAGGKSNLTYLLASEAGELVLRRPPDGAVLATAHDMGREARVQRALAGTEVPVATILLVDDGDALGVPFYVMERVPGLVVRDALPAGFAPTRAGRHAVGAALVDTLADLHSVRPADVGLADFGRPDGFVPRQLRRWRQQWEASRDDEVAAVDELCTRLSTRVPASRAAGIVHGDYRLDNCVVDAHDHGRIAAVLDWELSTLGDPLTDVGMFAFYWADAAAVIPSLIAAVTHQPGFPTVDDVTERWSARTGIPIDDLGWYRAFAHFKFAVIAAGIHRRVQAGAMDGQDFGDLRAEIAATAESGLSLVPA